MPDLRSKHMITAQPFNICLTFISQLCLLLKLSSVLQSSTIHHFSLLVSVAVLPLSLISFDDLAPFADSIHKGKHM